MASGLGSAYLPLHPSLGPAGWLQRQAAQWREGTVTIWVGPEEGYRGGIDATSRRGDSAGAKNAPNRFHIVGLADSALYDARRRTRAEARGCRVRKHDPL